MLKGTRKLSGATKMLLILAVLMDSRVIHMSKLIRFTLYTYAFIGLQLYIKIALKKKERKKHPCLQMLYYYIRTVILFHFKIFGVYPQET